MIYISNALYLSMLETVGKKPLIGWHSLITTTNITATSEDPDRPIENLWSPDTSQSWKAASTGTIYVQLDNSSEKSFNYIGIAKHNFGSAEIVYTLEQSENESDWEDLVSETAVTSDRAIVHYFDSSTARYVRLKMVAATVVPIIAHLKIGQMLMLQRPMYVGINPPTLSPKAKRITNGSESGQYLGQIVVRRWYETSCQQQNSDPAWVRSNLFDFIEHVQSARDDDGSAQGTFFYAWRPVDYPNEVIYGWTEDNIEPKNQRSNGMMEYSFVVQGVL